MVDLSWSYVRKVPPIYQKGVRFTELPTPRSQGSFEALLVRCFRNYHAVFRVFPPFVVSPPKMAVWLIHVNEM